MNNFFSAKTSLMTVVLVLIISTCMLIVPSSCNNENVDATNPSQSTQSISFAGELIKPINMVSKIATNRNTDLEQKFNLYVSEVPESDMKVIISTVQNKLDIPVESNNVDNIEYITTYTNNHNPNKISLDNVVGVSFFFTKGNGVKSHKLYRLNSSGRMELDPKYSADADIISINDIAYIAGSIEKGEKNVNAISYYSGTPEVASNSQRVYDFSQRVLNNADFMLSTEEAFACACGNGFDCTSDLKSCNGLCSSGEANSIAQSKGARISSLLNLSSLRDIRDNFMNQSKLGTKYVGYYYKLSDVSKRFDLINSSNYLDYIGLASDLVEAVNNLKSGDNNNLVIDDDLRKKSLKFIRLYRGVSQNKELQNILDDIEADLSNVSRKNKAQVLTYVKTQM